MANLSETTTYDTGIYQLETSDPVAGGPTGVDNTPHKNLANRTNYLKSHVDALETAAALLAPKASPALTGSPTSVTQPLGDNSTKIATDAFVQGTVGGLLTKSVAGNSNVTLSSVEAGNGILKFTGLLTGNIAVIVPGSPTRSWLVNNATTGAYTLTVKTSAGTGVVVAQTGEVSVYTDATNVYYGSGIVPQAEAETGTATTLRGWTAQRVNQAIVALANHGAQRFIANGTFTVPAGVTSINVTGCAAGAGGGGGGGNYDTVTTSSSGGGGGAGESIIKKPFSVTPGGTISITIGGAGTAGVAGSPTVNGGAGGNGGNTVIGALQTLTAGSGGLGGLSYATNPTPGAAGGAGYPAGGDSPSQAVGSIYGLAGTGASSPFGGGGSAGRYRGVPSAGKSAYGFGGGGGGGGGSYSDGVSGEVGGAGAPGLVIIEW